MIGVEFSCGYTRLKDVEGRSPCGRPAIRRVRGDSKCLGHLVVEQAISLVGGTEYARKVWIATSFLLLYLALAYALSAWSGWPLLIMGWSAVLFTLGLLVSTAAEWPLGGLCCLAGTPGMVYTVLGDGGIALRAHLNGGYRVPEFSSWPLELARSGMSTGLGVIFILYAMGIYDLYRRDDQQSMTWSRIGAVVLGVVVLVLVVYSSIASGGRYSGYLPFAVVVVLGILVARGSGSAKRGAQRLAAVLRV
ncbi:hypothetical protein Q5530_36540 [Saccharothrix sp. BKS2]|uniref:hypothetical protein n=1 Tax=Saccharothrix sp. BKS2 TaxID=3064400 RepID=UPI0039EAC49C